VGFADVAASFATIFDQDEAARKAGVTVVPHIGLDVGIDRVLCGVGARKLDKVDGFKVWCGGFPQKGTPGYNNPIRYKISWYWPFAALGNVGSSRVLKEGEVVDIPKLSDPEEIVFPEPIGKCEAIPLVILPMSSNIWALMESETHGPRLSDGQATARHGRSS